MTNGSAPTTEIGSENVSIARRVGLDLLTSAPPSWSSLARDVLENVPDLMWRPGGGGLVRTYHAMRSDAQVQGLYLGATLPIRRYTFALHKNGASARTMKRISQNYRIPVKGQEDKPLGRSKRRFKFKDHMRQAFLAVMYGHMFFEITGEVDATGYWNLRKLGPRMPQTIMDILTQDDGALQGIIQRKFGRRYTPTYTALGYLTGNVYIPVQNLVAYIWEQEGGDWVGRSMLRAIYKNWLLKDRVLRVGAINIARAGGVPIVRAPKGANKAQMDDLAVMAQQFRVGEDAGGSIPHDAELMLAKAAGGDDAVNFVKLQNEEMGRGFLMMFLNLGQTVSGSRALGGSFIDLALNAHETMADWFCDVFNEHVIEDDVDWNEGVDASAPLVSYTRTDDRELAVSDLVDMVNNHTITLDDELEAWIREEYRMPRRDPNTPARNIPSPNEPPDAQAERGGPDRAAVNSPLSDGPAARLEVDDLGVNREALNKAIKEQLVALGVVDNAD